MSARAATFAVITVVLLLLAGCSRRDRDDASEDPRSTTTTSGPRTTLTFVTVSGLGDILADARGHVVYVSSNDQPDLSLCYDLCAASWPPLVAVEKPTGPPSVGSQLGLLPRNDGHQQVSYRGRPLYFYHIDDQPAEAFGDGIGGVWFVVRRAPAEATRFGMPGPSEFDAHLVNYFEDVQGLLARPRGASSGTGIIVIHEAWGLNATFRQVVQDLASHGHVALAVDLFHGQVATNPGQAQQLAQRVDDDQAVENLRAATARLRSEGASRIATMGFGFGGGHGLSLALSGDAINTTILFYGEPLTDDTTRLDNVRGRVLALYGEFDARVNVTTVRGFERAMGDVGVSNDVHLYPDLGHAFANPQTEAWSPEDAHDAWQRALAFIEKRP